MTKSDISEPKQQRSIKKKIKIVEAGYKLFCKKGFYNTNTAEIAKEAGVSTGIVYRYFLDKRAIFLDSLPLFFSSFYSTTYKDIVSLSQPIDYVSVLDKIIDSLVASHDYSKDAHEEMMAMSHSDPQVKEYFAEANKTMNKQLAEMLKHIGLDIDHPYEKMHIIIEMIESYCHEIVFSKDETLDYNVLKKILINTIMGILAL